MGGVMHRQGIGAHAPRRYRVCTTDSKHALPIAANLLDRNFVAEKPDQVWLADITCIPTGEGWLSLAVILDLFTRKLVGWAMREHMRAELTMAALNGRTHHGRPTAPSEAGLDPSLGSRQPIRRRRLSQDPVARSRRPPPSPHQ